MQKNYSTRAGSSKIITQKSQKVGTINKHLKDKNSEYNLVFSGHKPSNIL